MSQAYLGEIRLLPYVNGLLPPGWAACDGQILSISSYSPLFSLLGTTYGGNGQMTFALPDLRGRVPIHQGTGFDLTQKSLGQFDGTETVTLLVDQMGPHAHAVQASADPASQSNPVGNIPAVFATPFYATAADGTAVNIPIGSTPVGQSHDNMAPTIALRYCICISDGEFPARE